jgi:hypothetical protein
MATDDERHLEYKTNFKRLQEILKSHPATSGLQPSTSMQAITENIKAIEQIVPYSRRTHILVLFHGLCAYRKYLDVHELLKRMLDQHGTPSTPPNTTFANMAQNLDALSTRNPASVRHIRLIYDMVRAYRFEEELDRVSTSST